MCDEYTGGGIGGGGNTGGGSSGGGNIGGGNIGGGDTGGGTVIGGGSGEVVPAARPGTTVVKNAAQDAVASVIKSYGNSEAACNVGVQ